jgi:DNA polymerase III epsilon subunit-like protein
MDPRKLWIMLDVETTGPDYARHSLVEIGVAAGSVAEGVVGRFEAVLKPVSEAVEASPESYARALKEGLDPAEGMSRFEAWCAPYQKRGALFVARPAAFDWPWIVAYSWRFLKRNPFDFKAVCASSWFQAVGKTFHVELPHVAVQDAEIQLKHFLAEG